MLTTRRFSQHTINEFYFVHRTIARFNAWDNGKSDGFPNFDGFAIFDGGCTITSRKWDVSIAWRRLVYSGCIVARRASGEMFGDHASAGVYSERKYDRRAIRQSWLSIAQRRETLSLWVVSS